MRKTRSAYAILIQKPQGKNSLGDLDLHENNIEMDVREKGCEDETWIQVGWRRFNMHL